MRAPGADDRTFGVEVRINRSSRRVARVSEPSAPAPDIDLAMSAPESAEFVDVRELMARYSVEDLVTSADDYYRTNIGAVEYWLAKPATNVDESIELLGSFAQVL